MSQNIKISSFWRESIDPDQDLHKVLIKRDELIDETRDNRPVKIKVYHPVAADAESTTISRVPGKYEKLENLPVIFWSHGLGGSVDGAAFLSRFVASYGYIIVHIQHHGTDTSLWEGKTGHPWDIIRKSQIPRSATLDRFQDVPFVLDQLPKWLEAHPDIAAKANLNTLGMSGHSFGALTTQVMAGMMYADEQGKLRRMRENRFCCGILYSPGPISHLSLDDPRDIYGAIDMPLLHITGTADSSPVEDWDYIKRLIVYENTTQAEKHLLILKDGDHMVYNGSRGKLGQSPYREKHERILKIAALAYWDAMLKEDRNAYNWLTGQDFKDWLGNEGSFK